jgi:tetratricopeptide (TPR) repeat protein
MIAALALSLLLAASASPVREAERLAEAALASAERNPPAALADARRALALTAEFEPTAFVQAGRKGEVLEDAFLAARAAYRLHRARLYDAVGEALARSGQAVPAARYLRRAVALDPVPARAFRLARALLAVGRHAEALAVLQDQVRVGEISAEARALFEQATDAARLPSAQFEIDRARLRTLNAGPPEPRDGPVALPAGARLSTGVPLTIEGAPLVLYRAEPSCRSCSQDLQDLRRVLPAGTRIAIVPGAPADDYALRQVLQLYRIDWPLAVGRGIAEGLALEPRVALVVARGGWAAATVRSPFAALPAVLTILSQRDLAETVPRERWSQRPPDRSQAAPLPPLRAGGFAPGDETPAPARFEEAVAAYDAHRPADALRLVDALAAEADAWLLPPEHRLDRALCLAALGRRDEARRILLRIGDSRFQEAVDAALDRVGSAGAK